MDIGLKIITEDDAEDLLKIYAPYVLNTAISFEYEVPSVSEFKKRINKTLENYPYIAAVSDGKTVGYAYAGRLKEREAYIHSVETTIYTDEAYRHMGIGKKLYTLLEDILKRQNVINLNACITYTDREDGHLTKNSPDFHKHMGYKLTGRFTKCGYKFGKWYDIIWMEKIISSHNPVPEEFKPFSEYKTYLTKGLL